MEPLLPFINYTLSPPPFFDSDADILGAWYGNIQYRLNISAIGLFCCVFIFLFVKLRSDHRQIPGPRALVTKLLVVWQAICGEIARHCGLTPLSSSSSKVAASSCFYPHDALHFQSECSATVREKNRD